MPACNEVRTNHCIAENAVPVKLPPWPLCLPALGFGIKSAYLYYYESHTVSDCASQMHRSADLLVDDDERLNPERGARQYPTLRCVGCTFHPFAVDCHVFAYGNDSLSSKTVAGIAERDYRGITRFIRYLQ